MSKFKTYTLHTPPLVEARPTVEGESRAIMAVNGILLPEEDPSAPSTDLPPGMVVRESGHPLRWMSKEDFDKLYTTPLPTLTRTDGVAVSLRAQVRMRLTAEGGELIYQKYGYSPWIADGDGWVRMPLFIAMAEFGGKCHPSAPPLIKDGLIVIE
jgi:hypothetical protein